jgi:phosphate starvation-inducible PhoH-like protein
MEYINHNQSLSLGQIKQFSNGNVLMDTSKAKPITYTIQGKQIYPKTFGQANLIEAMKEHDMVFNLGPAGTGKTFLSVAYGVRLLRENKIKRIILVRPAVEAGENLGFLPGDLKEKVDPYLQPLYDALNLLLGQESVEKYLEKGIIEIAPLAYMRGRTLDDAMVILDEAQNTTKAQMKMFLTRMGFNSKMIINGDITQIDLKSPSDSGLLEAIKILKGIPEISIFELGLEDIVRHALVNKILQRYQGE